MNHRDFRLAGKIFASLGVPNERWGMVNLTLEQQRTILKNSSIGFQYARAGIEFAHPNLLLVLDPKLRIAKWIYGTGYTGRDLDLALKVASGESDWFGQHSEWLYALLLFAGLPTLRCPRVLPGATYRSETRNAPAHAACAHDCH